MENECLQKINLRIKLMNGPNLRLTSSFDCLFFSFLFVCLAECLGESKMFVVLGVPWQDYFQL